MTLSREPCVHLTENDCIRGFAPKIDRARRLGMQGVRAGGLDSSIARLTPQIVALATDRPVDPKCRRTTVDSLESHHEPSS